MSTPRWTARIDQALERAHSQIHVLSAVTPTNAAEERARLIDRASRGRSLVPSWRYGDASTGDARPLLEAILRALTPLEKDPLAQIYKARAEELALEAELCEAAGTPAASDLAARRFAPPSRSIAKRAETLISRWSSETLREGGEKIATDSTEAGSLYMSMKLEVGKRSLPFRVVVHPSLPSLAATGDRVILIARGRKITTDATRRTVLHEIAGHVLPRHRASKQRLGIFRIGTARGVDQQEGLALSIEARAGFLVGARRCDLAARAKAVMAMRGGAVFADVVDLLKRDYEAASSEAILIAERIFRGSDGTRPGLGRESVYLESFVQVTEALKNKPDREMALASGQVSVEAADVLAQYCSSSAY